MNQFIASFLLILVQFTLTAKDIHVYPNKPDGIQSAINKAVSGDKIILHQGDYYEILSLLDKSNISIVADGDGLVRIYGVMKEFINPKKSPWKFIKKENNPHFKNTQWIYEATIPKVYQKINNSLPDYWTCRNYFYFTPREMLWSYENVKDFSKRIVKGTAGQGVLFEKSKVTIALNQAIEQFPTTQYLTYSGQVLQTGNLKNVSIDGGAQQLIEFAYAGRYCITGGGFMDQVTFKNLRITNPNDAFYFVQASGDQINIENCILKKRIPFDCLWADIKSSPIMGGNGVVYAGKDVKQFIIRGNTIEGFYNGIVASPGHTIIEDNLLRDIGDDAIELDGASVNTICRNNVIENAFVSFSLVPVEKGPVYIYDNLVISKIKSYPFQYLKDGSIRQVEPRLIKFWNLINGKKRKNGKMMKVSGNVHFYYNTFIAKKQPLTLGNYAKQEYSPVNSSFYNNVFISEGVITYSTGSAEDGIDIDNNVFSSSFKDKSEDRLFIGWNGKQHLKKIKNDVQWTNNEVKNLKYSYKEGQLKWRGCATKKALRKFDCKQLPASYPGAADLNKRTNPGANF